ncbi:hypothetical protein MKX01_028411 [Papaver californicum]|nr:hypothetical protein MKX01_028411 [Papaver californicum]
MVTRTLSVIQDENLHTHFRGPSRKALTNITNSSKLSPHKAASKKNLLEKSDNTTKQNGDTVGGKLKVSDGQKNAGLGGGGGGGGGRKALGDITNSRKLSLNQESKKKNPKKLNDIAGERFLYDHQKYFSVQLSKPDLVPAPLPPKVLGYWLNYISNYVSYNRYALSPSLMLLGSP